MAHLLRGSVKFYEANPELSRQEERKLTGEARSSAERDESSERMDSLRGYAAEQKEKREAGRFSRKEQRKARDFDSRMSAKYGALGGLTFGRDDARTLESVADGSVDCVVDKGTLDAVLCGEDSREGSAQLLAAALRVLKKKGVLLIVSHSKARAALIPPGAWKVATRDVAAPALDDAKPATTHYVYACTKIA